MLRSVGLTMKWPDSVWPSNVAVHVEGEWSLQGGDGDDVARGEFIDAIERGLVGGAMSSERRVPWLARQGSLGEMTGTVLQVLEFDALHHDEIDADAGDLDSSDGIAGLWDQEVGRGGERIGGVSIPGN